MKKIEYVGTLGVNSYKSTISVRKYNASDMQFANLRNRTISLRGETRIITLDCLKFMDLTFDLYLSDKASQ